MKSVAPKTSLMRLFVAEINDLEGHDGDERQTDEHERLMLVHPLRCVEDSQHQAIAHLFTKTGFWRAKDAVANVHRIRPFHQEHEALFPPIDSD